MASVSTAMFASRAPHFFISIGIPVSAPVAAAVSAPAFPISRAVVAIAAVILFGSGAVFVVLVLRGILLRRGRGC